MTLPQAVSDDMIASRETTAVHGNGALTEHLRWCRARGLRETTLDQRRLVLARFRRERGVDVLEAGRDVVEDWYESLTVGSANRATQLSHVKSYVSWAIRHDIITVDPTARLDRPRIPRSLPRPISEDRLRVAIEGAEGRMLFAITAAAFCGLRCCELVRVEWCHFIDSPDGTLLHVIEGKGGHERIVPAHDQVMEALKALPGIRRGRVIRRRDGRPGAVRPVRMSHEINDFLHGLGFDDTAHSLRHRYGTTVYSVSKDLMLTRGLMGHGHLNTTAGYVAWDTSRAQEVVKGLPRAGRAG